MTTTRKDGAKRCNAFGDMPSGLHVTEIENAYLNTAELRVKLAALLEEGGHVCAALIEGQQYTDLALEVQAAINRRAR